MQIAPQLQRADSIPLHHQIYLGLRDEICSGALPFGSTALTEHDLARRFGVSRSTAKRALQELAEQGYVERRRRVGTRVIYRAAKPAIEMTADQALESLVAFGQNTDVQVIHFAIEPCRADVAAILGLADDADVAHATRLRSLRDKPLGIVESFVPAQYAATLTGPKLAGRSLHLLLRDAGHEFGGGDNFVSAVGAGPALAAQLEVEPRAPILRVERITYTASKQPFTWTVAHYRADRYRLSLSMTALPLPTAG